MDDFKTDVSNLGEHDYYEACEICFKFLRTQLNGYGSAGKVGQELLDIVENKLMEA